MNGQETAAARELASLPIGDFIRTIALGIAEAQFELDKASMTVAELMSGQRLLRDMETGQLLDEYDRQLPDGTEPRIIDSRVFFGFDYEDQGSAAVATAEINADGQVTQLVVAQPGSDYTVAPEVRLQGGGGAGARFAAVIDSTYAIERFEQVDPGSGYTSPPAVIITPRRKRVPLKLSMMELGFTPNFYQFVDTVIELRLTFSLSKQVTTGTPPTTSEDTSPEPDANTAKWWKKGHNTVINTTPVDARYASSYNFNLQFSSVVKTKLVPIPPPVVMEERIREMMEKQRAEEEKEAGSEAT